MANKKLNATIAIGGTVARSLTRGLTNTKGQLAEVGGEIGKTTRRQRQLSDQIKTFGRQGRNVDGLRRQYAELGTEIDRLRRKQEGLQRLASANVGGRFSTMTNEVGRLARRTAMAGTAAAGAVFGVASSTASLGDNVAKTADKLGMGVEELQAYRYAAERSGVASNTFDTATQRMVRRVSEAARGTGPAKDAIEELGLSAQALASMTPDEQLNQFADALQNVENQGDRVRLSMKLFDTEGVAMINMLRGGSEGLRELGGDARRTGYILSEKAARDAESFQDTLLDTQLSLFGLKNIIGAELMPVVGDMMGKFTGWLADNRDQVGIWAKAFATGLQNAVPAILSMAEGLATVIGKIGSAASTTADLVGGFDNLGIIIGTVIAGKAIGSIVMFGTAIFQAGGALLSLSGAMPLIAGGVKAIGAALMANPIGLIIGAIAGAGYLIYRNWEKIGPWFGKLWQGVQEKVAWAWDKVKGVIAWHPLALIARNWGAITDWFGRMGERVKAAAGTAWAGIKTVLSWSPLGLIARAWSGLGDRVGSVAELAKAAAGVAWEGIKTVLSWSPLGLIARAWSGLGDRVGSVAELAKAAAGVAWKGIKTVLSWSPLGLIARAWSGLGDRVGSVAELAKAAAGVAWEGIKTVLSWSPLGLIARAWSGLGDRVGSVAELAKAGLDVAWAGIKTVLSWSPLGLIARAWSGLSDRVGSIGELAKAGLEVAWAGIKTVLSWSPLGLIARAWSGLSDFVGTVTTGAKTVAGAAWDWMKEKLSWSPLEAVAAAWGGLTGWFGGLWDGITAKAAAALDWITSKLEWVGNAFSAVSGWFSSGSDQDERPQLGGSNAQPINLGESQREAEDRGREVIARGPERPQFSESSPPPAASTMVERVKEVTQTITNNVQLHVTPMQGEDDQSYAERIAELVMDEINQRQQGALYDG